MQHSSLLTGSFWVYKLAWNGPRQTLGATKKPKQRDWNLNSQSRKESWNTVSLEQCQKMTRLPVRSKFWVRVRVTATRRFVDLNGFAKASTWASCQVSNFSNQINPRQKKNGQLSQPTKQKKNCAHLHALGIASKNPGQQGHPESQGLRWSDSIRITTITSDLRKNLRFARFAPLETNCLQRGNWPGRTIFLAKFDEHHGGKVKSFSPRIVCFFLDAMGNR